ncbi:hypothetical protein HMPREF3182_01450 [Megasphaera hutchinsoni]|uniref:Uncharacterized protein n=1 Tax=Megasphaera hutchinsoni TaxID=1588748 RepID=A0A134CDG7_9FIRM|nr:hypothetical protein HMPREF3182_01450 [Megasphaera hutchinsoni]
MRKKHYNDKITDEEFEDWKLSYPKNKIFKIVIYTHNIYAKRPQLETTVLFFVQM